MVEKFNGSFKGFECTPIELLLAKLHAYDLKQFSVVLFYTFLEIPE